MAGDGRTTDAPADFIADFAARAGLRGPVADDEFWPVLEGTFGDLARDVRRAIDAAFVESDPHARREKMQTVYDLKNVDIELALALSSQYRSVVSRSLMRWMDRSLAPAPRRILDIGCDIGLVTSFLAARFPGAEVLGIDSSRAALRRAVELAARLGLTNARFQPADALSLEGVEGTGSYDLVVAVNVFEYAIDFPPPAAYFSLREAVDAVGGAEPAPVLALVASMLEPGTGRFVSAEQFESAAVEWWWIASHVAAGLSIDWPHCGQLRTDLDDVMPGLMPLVASTRRDPVEPSTLDDFVASELVRQLEGSGSDRELRLTSRLAEALFERLEPKTFLRGIEVVHPPTASGRIPLAERFEMWEAGPLLAVFRTSNDGLRELELRSRIASAEVAFEIEARARLVAEPTGARVEPYAPGEIG